MRPMSPGGLIRDYATRGPPNKGDFTRHQRTQRAAPVALSHASRGSRPALGTRASSRPALSREACLSLTDSTPFFSLCRLVLARRLHAHPPHTWKRRPEGGVAGNGKDTAARPRAPGGRPGALQGHRKGPLAARSCNLGGARCGGRHGPRHRGEGRARGSKRDERGMATRSEDPATATTHAGHGAGKGGTGGRGRAGFRTPRAPSTHRQREEGRSVEGARGQSEKSGPIRHECPSLVWRGLGPARENATAPHRSGRDGRTSSESPNGDDAKAPAGAGRGQRRRERARFLPRQPRRGCRRVAGQTPRGERLTRAARSHRRRESRVSAS